MERRDFLHSGLGSYGTGGSLDRPEFDPLKPNTGSGQWVIKTLKPVVTWRVSEIKV